MQLDYMDWLFQYGIYAVAAIGALIIAILARSCLTKTMDDKLRTPTYEKIDSGVKISVSVDDGDP